MDIYLPIAETSANLFLLVALGGLVGGLSGLFGVGGGFLLTPMLIFIGIPPPVAVATGANQLVAASAAGALAHWQRGNVDTRMGMLLVAGGFAGSWVGVRLFAWLKEVGQIDLVIALCYVVLLGSIGGLMLFEGVRAALRRRHGQTARRGAHRSWVHGLPFKMRFPKSRLYISALPPIGIGAFIGLLAALMGVGGGFLMIPAMIYLLRMPTSVVIGTSLFQITFVAANVTLLQAINTQTVDVTLALLIAAGAVIGAQFGSRWGRRFPAEQLRALLGLMVLAVAAQLLYGLLAPPEDPYAVELPVGA